MQTCWECSQRIHEECGLNGREVFPDTEACNQFEQEDSEWNDNQWSTKEKNIVIVGEVTIFSEDGRIYGDVETKEHDELTEILIEHKGRRVKITVEFLD